MCIRDSGKGIIKCVLYVIRIVGWIRIFLIHNVLNVRILGSHDLQTTAIQKVLCLCLGVSLDIHQDVYKRQEEVLTRRFTHESKGEFDSFSRFPDLILMDGGRGQVNIALKVLGELGIDIPVCGMVKDDNHRTRGVYFNNVEIPIDTSSEGFHLVTRIQDEAHRFAIEYHRSLRSKEQVHSVLDDIPGIGETRRKALMRRFRSIENIRDASVEELSQTESMNMQSAESVYAFFHKIQH